MFKIKYLYENIFLSHLITGIIKLRSHEKQLNYRERGAKVIKRVKENFFTSFYIVLIIKYFFMTC